MSRAAIVRRVVLFLFFAACNYAAYYLLAPKPLGFEFSAKAVTRPPAGHDSALPNGKTSPAMTTSGTSP